MRAADLQALCEDRLVDLLDQFGNHPTVDALTSITVVAEMIMALPPCPATEWFRARLAIEALSWLRNGLLDDIAVTRAEFVYPVALLCHVASTAPTYRVDDTKIIGRLIASRMIGASELPTLTRRLLTQYFALAGHQIAHDREDLTRDMIDKRVLRRRTDEYDLMALCIVGQLSMLQAIDTQALPIVYPTIFLMEAMRSGELNWLPPLVALGTHVFKTDAHLVELATRQIERALEEQTDLLPPPATPPVKNDLREHAMTGLRLRSSIACCVIVERAADAAIK